MSHTQITAQLLFDLTQCFKNSKKRTSVRRGERETEMAHLVEKVGHAFCYIHSEDTVEYPVLASTVQILFICIQHVGASRRRTSIHKAHFFLKRKKTQDEKKRRPSNKGYKDPPLLCNNMFSCVAGQEEKSTVLMILGPSGVVDLEKNHMTPCWLLKTIMDHFDADDKPLYSRNNGRIHSLFLRRRSTWLSIPGKGSCALVPAF